MSKDLCNTTEPHRNVAVSAKHYRFFLSGLKDLFEVLFLIPFIKTRDFIKQFCDLSHKTFQFKGWMKFKRNDQMNVAIFKWGKQLIYEKIQRFCYLFYGCCYITNTNIKLTPTLTPASVFWHLLLLNYLVRCPKWLFENSIFWSSSAE